MNQWGGSALRTRTVTVTAPSELVTTQAIPTATRFLGDPLRDCLCVLQCFLRKDDVEALYTPYPELKARIQRFQTGGRGVTTQAISTTT